MKKFLLLTSLFSLAFISTAQTPLVPNGDFEDWIAGKCAEIPAQYSSELDALYNISKFCPTVSGVAQSSESVSGKRALQLTATQNTIDSELSETSIYLASTLGSVGVKFDGRPSKFIGYTKYSKGSTDSLMVSIEFLDVKGNSLFYRNLIINTYQKEYTKFEIPLKYENENAVASLIIRFKLGSTDKSASKYSLALIDALSFEYPITTATTNYSATSTINVFAANKNIHFSENVSDVHVVDMTGVNALQETAATKQINAANLKNGLYVVTYKFNDNYYSKKIVLE